MRFISELLGGSDDRTPEERRVDVLQHQAYRDAGNQAARNLRGDGGPLVHDMLNEAIIDAEQHVSWWRR